MGEGLIVRRGNIASSNDTLILYDNGDECTPVTGGLSIGFQDTNGILTKNASDLQLDSSNNSGVAGNIAVLTNDLIDLTNYSVLKCKVTITGTSTSIFRLGVTQTRTQKSTDWASGTYQNDNITDGEISLDVSSLNGSYYVGVGQYAYPNGTSRQSKTKEIYLEV